MLENSKAEWFEASADEKRAAEVLAHSYMVSELEQNLIPHDEAQAIVDARMATFDETWARAVYGMLIALRRARIAVYPEDEQAMNEVPSLGQASAAHIHDDFTKDPSANAARAS